MLSLHGNQKEGWVLGPCLAFCLGKSDGIQL